MQIISWLRKMVGLSLDGRTQPMAEGTCCILQTEDSSPIGALLCHNKEAKDRFLAKFASAQALGHCGHDGALSVSIVDQLGPAASSVWASVRAGNLVQIVGDPLQGGANEFVQAAQGFTGTVRDVASKKFVEQAQFTYASCTPIVAPVVAFQVIHVLAGVQQMRSIDERLACLQRTMEEMIFRHQATSCGKLYAAIECMNDLESEYLAIGHFSDDMTMRLIIAERDLRTVAAEQQAVIHRFSERSEKLVSETQGRNSLVEVDQLLRESGDTYLRDAAIAVETARAQLKVSRAWIAHDVEHVPGYVQKRVMETNQALDVCSQIMQQLDAVDRLRDYAAKCTESMNQLTKFMYRRVVARALTHERQVCEQGAVVETPVVPSYLVWQDANGHTNAVSQGILTAE